MKVQKYRFMVLMMVAAEWLLILFNSSHLAAAEGPIIADPHENYVDRRYKRVRFNITHKTTADGYSNFIKNMSDHLKSGSFKGIPRLPDRNTLPITDINRFVLVELTNGPRETVTLAIDAGDVYLVAYQVGTQSFFFRDAPAGATSRLFAGTTPQNMSFNSNYFSLEKKAGKERHEIDLGKEDLIRAVTSLFHANDDRTKSRSLIVVIQMICETVRFKNISGRVLETFGRRQSFKPDTYMLSLENSWKQQSTAVQQSYDNGTFKKPLTLQLDDGKNKTLRQVDDVINNLALMLFDGRGRSSIMSSHGHDDQYKFRHPDPPLPMKSVVGNVGTWPNLEPTVRISGRDGLCVDVRDGAYHNGNPIQLWPCKTNEDPNQLWTIRSDGTIRSNGRCLTTNGYAAGDYVIIFDCDTAVKAATRWVISHNGTIFNPQSQLVLGAGGKESRGTILTVQTNVYASRQGWSVSNDTSPREVTIVGLHDLCMQGNGTAMRLQKCVSGKQEQIWTLYGDGSIRPKQNQDRCLTCLSDTNSTPVTIESCSSGSSGQRWVFTNEATILNLNNGMVMNVRPQYSNPSLGEIIISPVTGNPNQEWFPLPA